MEDNDNANYIDEKTLTSEFDENLEESQIKSDIEKSKPSHKPKCWKIH